MRRTVGAAWMAAWVVVAGCGGDQGTRANVRAGSMPPGGTFTGVWFSPQYGEMNVIQSGTAIVGEYQKDERAGKFEGRVTGNLARFQWSEERSLVQGRPSVTRGHGYFRYEIGDDGRHNLIGEWGLDDDEVGGGVWNAYKMRNRRPRLSTDESNELPGGPTELPSGPSEDTNGGSDTEPQDTSLDGPPEI